MSEGVRAYELDFKAAEALCRKSEERVGEQFRGASLASGENKLQFF
jgi:hypothetical protein